jgi:DNA repair exonuclease SbcCD ATPase subunit
MTERNGKKMKPCLSLEDAISQIKDTDERKELEFQYRCLMENMQDKMEEMEAKAESADDYYDSWREAEDECESLNDQIYDLETQCKDYEDIEAELEEVAGKSIEPDEALSVLNKLLEIVGEKQCILP